MSHIYEWVTSHKYKTVKSHTYEWVMTHIWTSHFTHLEVECMTLWISCYTHMNQSRHTYERVMSHTLTYETCGYQKKHCGIKREGTRIEKRHVWFKIFVTNETCHECVHIWESCHGWVRIRESCHMCDSSTNGYRMGIKRDIWVLKETYGYWKRHMGIKRDIWVSKETYRY